MKMEHSNIIQRCVREKERERERERESGITKNVPQNIDKPKLLHEC
jgi:hypothetical protein